LKPIPGRFKAARIHKRYKNLLRESVEVPQIPGIRFIKESGLVVAIAACCWTIDHSGITRQQTRRITATKAIACAKAHECTPFPTFRDAVEAAKILELCGLTYDEWMEMHGSE
jgi:hypothetical protein